MGSKKLSLSTKIFLFLVVTISVSSSADIRIGIRNSNGDQVTINTSTKKYLTKKAGNEFKVWCDTGEEWPQNGCTWHTPVEICHHPGPCSSGSISREGTKCVFTSARFEASAHQGPWVCVVYDPNNVTHSSASTDLQLMREAEPAFDVDRITLNPGDKADVTCRTLNTIFPPHPSTAGTPLIHWSVAGRELEDFGDVTRDCGSSTPATEHSDDLCYYESTVRYEALTGDRYLECTSSQVDDFGWSASKTIDLNVYILDDGAGVTKFTGAQIAGIVLGVLLPLLLLLLICCLCFLCGCCCFGGRRRRRSNEERREKQASSMAVSSTSSSDLDLRPQIGMMQQAYQPPPRPPPKLVVSDTPRRYDHPDPFPPTAPEMPPSDELLIYAWEGYGPPHSRAGSLSTLISDSDHHVDDLKLNDDILDALGTTDDSDSATPTTSHSRSTSSGEELLHGGGEDQHHQHNTMSSQSNDFVYYSQYPTIDAAAKDSWV